MIQCFSSVVVKKLTSLQKAIEPHLNKKQRPQVRYMLPEECGHYLERRAAESASSEKMVHGYKVKVKYHPQKDDDQKASKEEISL